MAFFQLKPPAKIVKVRPVLRNPPPETSLFQDFVQNTSLLGVQHFLRNKSFVWLLAYLICVVMSIAQSWSVTLTFIQQKTFHTVTRASKTPIPFPSVTVCTNTVLRADFDFSRIPGFDVEIRKKLLKECHDKEAMNKMKKQMEANTDAALHYLRTLSHEERFALGLNLTKVIERCKFNSRRCNLSDPNDVYTYSDPIFGNCFTFNPAFNDASAKAANMEDHLRLRLRFPSKGYWVTSRSKAKVAVQVHSPGTAPLIESADVSDVFADAMLGLSLTIESEMFSLKKRTTTIPSCIDSDDETYRRRSIHYSNKSPYRYSQAACLKTCKAKAFSECNLTLAYSPVQSKKYEAGKKVAVSAEDCELKPITMEGCNCPISCKKTAYGVKRDDNEMFNFPCDDHHDATIHPQNNRTIKPGNEYDNEVRIIATFTTNIYHRIDEELCYGLSEYLGILGGNMSLWIGLCIISLLEVVELVIKLILAGLRPQRKQIKPTYEHVAASQRNRYANSIKTY